MTKSHSRPLLLIFVVLLGILVASCGVPPQSSTQTTKAATSSTQAVSSSNSPFSVSAHNTAGTSIATNTQTLAGPILGGNIDAFIAIYGSPNDHSIPGILHFQRDSKSNTDGIIVSLGIGGNGYTNQVDDISVQPINGASWNATTAQAACNLFAPADAQQIGNVPITQAYDLIYTSATLAHVFPPDAFTDALQDIITPGTFDIQYQYASDNIHIDGCNIEIGKLQAQG